MTVEQLYQLAENTVFRILWIRRQRTINRRYEQLRFERMLQTELNTLPLLCRNA